MGDTASTTVSVAEAGTIVTTVTNAADQSIRSWISTSVAGANALAWDGRNQDGTAAPDGDYTLHFTARDRAGTNGAGKTRDVRVVRLLGSVKTSAGVFFPHDNDRLAKTASLSFALARPATVTWTIRNAAGQVVATPPRGRGASRPAPRPGSGTARTPRAPASRSGSTPRTSPRRTARTRSANRSGSR